LEIRYAAARVKGCSVRGVELVGLADADGPARRNRVLSQARAHAAASELAAAGLPAPSFTLQAFGGAGARTPDGDAEPLRRRTEVVIRARPAEAPKLSPAAAPRRPGA
jgi:outer membrane protein OmpA-like peptidoglycan-associated protein